MTNYKTENIVVNIDDIRPNTWNPNKMNKTVYEAEKQSLLTYGMVSPIVIRKCTDEEGYEIVDGEHRYTIWYELGHKDIPCILIHNLQDKDAKKLTIILNETKGSPDKIELGKLLADLQVDFKGDLNIGLPFTSDVINDLIDFGNVDWDSYNQDTESTLDESAVFRVHLTFKGDEIDIVKEKLGDNPENAIIRLLTE